MCDNLCIECNIRPRYRRERYCATCSTRRKRTINPVGSAYSNLKQNAKRRGHAFDLTLEQFKAFCVATDYIVRKGTSKESYTIDRIDPTKGYTLDNLQVMTNQENGRKSNKVVYDIRDQSYTVLSQYILTNLKTDLSNV